MREMLQVDFGTGKTQVTKIINIKGEDERVERDCCRYEGWQKKSTLSISYNRLTDRRQHGPRKKKNTRTPMKKL